MILRNSHLLLVLLVKELYAAETTASNKKVLFCTNHYT